MTGVTSSVPKIDPVALYEKLGALIEQSKREFVARGDLDLSALEASGNDFAAAIVRAAAVSEIGSEEAEYGTRESSAERAFKEFTSESGVEGGSSGEFVRFEEPGEVDWIADPGEHKD
jgi:hypothetical protein